jgi:hypothetical protein
MRNLCLVALLALAACTATPSTIDGGADATLDVGSSDTAAGDTGSDGGSDLDCTAYVPYDATATSDAGCFLPGSPCINPFTCCSMSCSAKSLDNGCEITVCAL